MEIWLDGAPDEGGILSLLAGRVRLLDAGEPRATLQYIAQNSRTVSLILPISFINTEKKN